METDGYDDDPFELPFADAITVIANDLGGRRETVGKDAMTAEVHALTADLSADALAKAEATAIAADPHRRADPMWEPPREAPIAAAAPYSLAANGHDPP